MPLIVFEGIDGCGKSTQVGLLVERLRAEGIEPILLREPGGTKLGEEVRSLLLSRDTLAGPRAELFGYLMARSQLVQERLKPALTAGETVVLDRFWYSTIAYQGHGLRLDLRKVRAAIELAIDGLSADLALLLQIDPLRAAQRRESLADDRIEARGLSYLQRVAQGYESLVDENELRPVNADRSVEAVAADVWSLVAPLLTHR